MVFNIVSFSDNFHEIRLVGEGPAAFLDILSPPYNTETEDGHLEFPADERRDCGFYQVSLCTERNRTGIPI